MYLLLCACAPDFITAFGHSCSDLFDGLCLVVGLVCLFLFSFAISVRLFSNQVASLIKNYLSQILRMDSVVNCWRLRWKTEMTFTEINVFVRVCRRKICGTSYWPYEKDMGWQQLVYITYARNERKKEHHSGRRYKV